MCMKLFFIYTSFLRLFDGSEQTRSGGRVKHRPAVAKYTDSGGIGRRIWCTTKCRWLSSDGIKARGFESLGTYKVQILVYPPSK